MNLKYKQRYLTGKKLRSDDKNNIFVECDKMIRLV